MRLFFPSSQVRSPALLSRSASLTSLLGTCPYITSVGSTQLDPTGLIEIGADFGGSGSPSGGFSNYFPVPSYQSSQVSSYISSLGSTYAGLYNTSGRGFPDVSAVGVNYTLVWEQGTVVGSGTSCSAPTFASVIALLNDQLIGAGKSPLGFLNPWLYSANGTAALTDILTGQRTIIADLPNAHERDSRR